MTEVTAPHLETGVQPETAEPAVSTSAAPAKKGFEVGEKILALATFDGQSHLGEVIEKKASEDCEPEYYVHYSELNKRMDEWVPASKVQPYLPGGTMLSVTLASPRVGATPGTPGGDSMTPGSGDRKLTRNLKRRYDEIHHVEKPVEDLNPIDQVLEKEHDEKTKMKNIEVIEMGKWEVDTWYYAPYPEEYSNVKRMYICEYCLKYMKKEKTLSKHQATCTQRSPPGKLIYHDQGREIEDANGHTTQSTPLSVFEVDGSIDKIYCQNLCLIAKLFLDHKTLYFDVEPFLFYILTEQDENGHHVAGYFSKEKHCAEEYNLACILTLPPYQRKGYGRFLISLSYELSKKEGRVGTPERPLSDLGQVSYRGYWTRVLLDVLREFRGSVSIKHISTITSIRHDDIVSTLQSLHLIKYWKGQYIISVTPKIIEEHLKTVPDQPHSALIPENLNWTPPVFAAKVERTKS
eukprot:CAMPEP_0198207764 /NCGR_PEP_ID=MMETSP1445-20131203/11191_1 /TAXON_ID=36898 /ORGANISM="Pyramimonas sp., Strain CCMP2087" /LENGTH=462 /DNA_ID=CAMNT_0043880909 /DNA_START=74 /DNA_END=1462 /DNA_ORIENTATION=-